MHVMSMSVREVLGSEKLDEVPQNRQSDLGESQGGQLTADAKGSGSTVVAKGDKPTVVAKGDKPTVVAKGDKPTVVAKGDKVITSSKVEKSSPLKDAINEGSQRTVVRVSVCFNSISNQCILSVVSSLSNSFLLIWQTHTSVWMLQGALTPARMEAGVCPTPFKPTTMPLVGQ